MPDGRFGYMVAAALACLAVTASQIGCDGGDGLGGDEYDWEREEHDRGTLGEELFAIWRKDADRAPEKAEARVEMLDGQESAFVGSVDRLAPSGELEAIDTFLQKTNRSIDSGLLPTFTRKIRISLSRASEDPDLLEALAADSGPSVEDYLAEPARPNLPAYALTYGDIRPATRHLVGTLLSADGVDASGESAEGESTVFADAQQIASRRLSELSSGESSPAVELRDVLLLEAPEFESDRDVAIHAVLFDRRGLPRVTDASGGANTYRPIAPFVDADGDGLADADSEGRFVLRGLDNRRLAPYGAASPDPFDDRDDVGRLTRRGTPAFEYVRLADTGLHWLLRQVDTFHREDLHWKLLDSLPALLGDRVRHDTEEGSYRGYDPDQPLLDVVEVGLEVFNFEDLPAALRGLARFFERRTTELAHLLEAFADAKSKIDALPDAGLTDDSTIGYDLLPILEEAASKPALWADVFDGLAKPVTSKTGAAMATLLKFKNLDTLPDKSGSYDSCFNQCKVTYKARETKAHPNGIGLVGRFQCIRDCPIDELFTKETDFEAPEAKTNRSANQQLFHLLRDTAGMRYAMTVEEVSLPGVDISDLPPIIDLPSSAEAFVRSVAGNLDIENYVSSDLWNDPVFGTILKALGVQEGDLASLLSLMSGLFGTHLSEEPTPSQITRLFNQPDLKFTAPGVEVDVKDPVCKDGYVMANHHADKLFASEASGLIDAVQPLAKAFSDHRREDLFTALFEVVHEHYSKHDDLYKKKDGSPSPMKGANLVSFEPALYDIAKSGDLFRALHNFAVAVDRTDPVEGEPFEERLRQIVYRAVTSRSRGGDSIEGPNRETKLTLPDGTEVENPSRMHYLLSSVGALVDRVQNQPEQKKKLQSALETMTSTLLATESSSSADPAFENPGTVTLLSLAARQLAESAEQWVNSGTLDDVLTEDAPGTAEDVVSSRELAVAIDLVDKLGETPDDRETLDGMVGHFLAQPRGRDELAAAAFQYFASSDASRTAPIGEALGRIVDPERTWETDARAKLPFLSHVLTIVDRTVERDESETGFGIARRGLGQRSDGQTSFGVLGEVIGDYYRVDPPSDAPYSKEDYRRVFQELADWIGDDVHGLEQVYDLVGRRADAE